jgi:dGTPase
LRAMNRSLAPYACKAEETRGRLYPEPESASRTVFQRDRDRIIHSAAFRRLKHKTQVFVYHEGDHYRTRLTHSLEVAQIARSISRALNLDEDLAEALALAHDLGHTPFGHAGEEALDAVMAPFGGFDHNDQTLRILTQLERRYAEFDGLNLTWETLEGVVKHNGPLLPERPGRLLPRTIAEYVTRHDLELATNPGVEAQVASLADDLAYVTHDIDDGLRAGLLTTAELAKTPLAGPIFAAVAQRYPGIETPRLIHESIRRLIDAMVNDMLAETRNRLAATGPISAAKVRRLPHKVAAFSAGLAEDLRVLKDFMFRSMYRHYKVNRMTAKARRVVRELFALYVEQPDCLPDEWRAKAEAGDEKERAILVADYIAGMTDRYALEEHRRLFDPYTVIP